MRVRQTLIGIGALALVASVLAQAPAERLAFDVVSVKPNTQSQTVSPSHFTVRSGGYLTIGNYPLNAIIETAYQIQEYQLVGGPDAIMWSTYDVEARAAGMPPLRFPSAADAPGHPLYPMLRAMLADRFKLVVHHEMRQFSAYALVTAKPDGTLGPKLTRSTTDCGPINAARGTDDEVRKSGPNGAPVCGLSGSPRGGFHIVGDSLSMPFILSEIISTYAGRPVVDRTGLQGLYNFTLDFSDPKASAATATPLPSFFTALEEQLGLRLQSTTASFDVVVIDHVERPSED